MFDTNVLSHLVGPEPQRGTAEHDFWMAAKMVTSNIDEVIVSSMVYYELHDVLLAPGRTLADAVAQVVQLDVRPIDLAIVDKASKILHAARSVFESCPRCRAWKGEHPCKKCGTVVPHQYKKNDAIIAAHADYIADVSVLYTFDGPMLKLATQVRSDLSIQEPPHPAGELWEDAKQKERERQKTAAHAAVPSGDD